MNTNEALNKLKQTERDRLRKAQEIGVKYPKETALIGIHVAMANIAFELQVIREIMIEDRMPKKTMYPEDKQ